MFSWLFRLIPEPDIRGRLLREQDEVIIAVVPHHWIVYVRPALLGLGALAAFLLALTAPGALSGLLSLLAIGVALWATYLALAERMDIFVVTNIRIGRANGVFSRKWATMPLTRILDVAVDQPLVGRFTGYGHFTFENAAQDQALRHIHHVGAPSDLDRVIQGAVQTAQGRPRVA